MGDENRKSRPGDGSVSVIDPKTDQVVATGQIPGGGSPDMGGVSADGTKLWLSGRYDSVVYVFDTTTGTPQEDPRRPRAPRTRRVAPARPLLARAHRQHPVTRSS